VDDSQELFGADGLPEHACDIESREIQTGPGDYDDGNVPRVRLGGDFLADDKAADVRKHQVEDDEVGAGLIDAAQGIETDTDVVDVKSGEGQRGAKHPAHVSVVLDHENLRWSSRHVLWMITGIDAVLNLSRG
jgi:hypothetical protein